MKLLFDQNISYRILKRIEVSFPGSNHVSLIGLHNTSDIDIWNYAKLNSYHIVTFDVDFSNISTFKGVPPKIIWLRMRDMRLRNISALIHEKTPVIKDFLTDRTLAEIAVLEISDYPAI
jgi:predicted nuclease of predicted toxin-antitoxin system